jgi:hypothetical protein
VPSTSTSTDSNGDPAFGDPYTDTP